MSSATIRAIVADDSQLARQLLRLALAQHEILVVAEATSVDGLRLLCDAERPDIVISAPRVGGSSVGGTVDGLRDGGIDVVIVSSDLSVAEALPLLNAGATGYVTRDLTAAQLAEAVRVASAGGSPLDPRCATAVLAEWRTHGVPGRAEVAAALSPREQDVLRLLASGLSAKEVAANLGLSVKTVENHTTRIFAKLGVRSRAEAVAVALGRGAIGEVDAGEQTTS